MDKFTKSTILRTKNTTIWTGLYYHINFSALKINDSRYLEIAYTASSIFSIDKDLELMFLMSDESITTLKAIESEIADHYGSGSGAYWALSVSYKLSDADHEALLNGKIKTIRLYTAEGYVEKEISKKRSDNLGKILKCI